MSMFEEKMEKGLFTFYWEQHEKQKELTCRDRRNKLSLTIQISQQQGVKNMEEKHQSKRRHIVHKKQTKRILRNKQEIFLNCDKQNRYIVVPNQIALSPQLAFTHRLNNNIKHIKLRQSSNLPDVKVEKKQRSPRSISPLDKLLQLEKSLQCHRQTIQIDDSKIFLKSRCLNNLKLMKMKKTITKQQPHQEKCYLYLSNQKLPTIYPLQYSQRSANPFPALPKKLSHKKLKHIKEKYIVSKLQSEMEGDSIVNIGVSSNDDYIDRWKKRKQEFMNSIKQVQRLNLIQQ